MKNMLLKKLQEDLNKGIPARLANLNQEELDHLMSDLKQCSMPYTCPHGRPTIIEINERELAKKFRRIV